MLRRHAWLIVEAMIVVGILAAVFAQLRDPSYRATASVLLRPNDPAEQLNPANAERSPSDPDRYVEAQKSIVRSAAVAEEALKRLRGVTAGDVQHRVSVEQGGRSDILKISATDVDPVRARDIANAVAAGYIENRRKSAVAGLQQAADDIQTKLIPLQATIAQLDAQIDSSPTSSATAAPQAPFPPPTGQPAGPAPPIAADTALAGQPTTNEALKATRYAAAVQYETLFARQQELLVDITLKRGEAEMIAEANTPRTPVSPRPVRDTVLGAAAGLLLGLGIVLLREQFRDRIRTSDDVERITGLPTLAQLPFDEETSSSPTDVAAMYRPLSPLAEAVRSLRTSIQYLSVDRPMKRLLVTSAVSGEGKSLVAANLAVVCAQAGYRTILLSADIRRAGVAKLFGVSPSAPGLTNMVTRASENGHGTTANGLARRSGTAVDAPAARTHTITANLVATPHPLLSYLPSGPLTPNPAEILGSGRMLDVLDEVSAAADVVVIDTPPLLPVTDAAVLAAKVDGVVLVAAIGETRREALKRASSIITRTRATVLGTVVNKTPRTTRPDVYSYYQDPPAASKARRRTRHEATAEPNGRRSAK